ncbi:MAG: AAA family ATPase, partial [Phycisphaerae bacterium]|nr:AAA family ATPase [Phycisphaerae bacterium]
QVFDDGRLTDGKGRTVNFTNTIIVMTSNLASDLVQTLTEKQAERWEMEAQLNEALKQQFRPEFLNRIDETVVFGALSKADLLGVVDIQIAELSARLSDRRICLEITDAAKELLCEFGYDLSLGARPLKRVIQQRLENPLATKILAGEIREDENVTIDATGKSFTFEATETTVAEAQVAEE